jgi:flagellar biosynthesis chaperone FliJ
MKDLYKKTKEELVAMCRRLQSENESLQDELDRLSDCYTEMENNLADNHLNAIDSIRDVNHFKYRLQLENLLTEQLESFIDDYLKYYNEIKG